METEPAIPNSARRDGCNSLVSREDPTCGEMFLCTGSAVLPTQLALSGGGVQHCNEDTLGYGAAGWVLSFSPPFSFCFFQWAERAFLFC